MFLTLRNLRVGACYPPSLGRAAAPLGQYSAAKFATTFAEGGDPLLACGERTAKVYEIPKPVCWKFSRCDSFPILLPSNCSFALLQEVLWGHRRVGVAIFANEHSESCLLVNGPE